MFPRLQRSNRVSCMIHSSSLGTWSIWEAPMPQSRRLDLGDVSTDLRDDRSFVKHTRSMRKNRSNLSHASAHQPLTKRSHQESIEEVWRATSTKYQGDVHANGQWSCRNTELNADGCPNVEARFQFSGFQLKPCVSCMDRLGVDDLRRIALGGHLAKGHGRCEYV